MNKTYIERDVTIGLLGQRAKITSFCFYVMPDWAWLERKDSGVFATVYKYESHKRNPSVFSQNFLSVFTKKVDKCVST